MKWWEGGLKLSTNGVREVVEMHVIYHKVLRSTLTHRSLASVSEGGHSKPSVSDTDESIKVTAIVAFSWHTRCCVNGTLTQLTGPRHQRWLRFHVCDRD